MLTGIHFLLTYKCIFECDHCFVYSSPSAEGTFTYEQFSRTLDEADKIGTVKWIYLEGGEPFLYYPLLIDCLKEAKRRGYTTGIVTNAYFATTAEDAEIWLSPLKELDVADLSISSDELHSGTQADSAASRAIRAAKKLGLNVNSISIDKPELKVCETPRVKGEPVVGGDVMFRGRATDKLACGLPGVKWSEFNECRFEELESPERVHVDSYGNVHICQGISIGNMLQTPLAEIIKNYDAKSHPIVRYILSGGPAMLAEHYGTKLKDEYIDACQLCYETRKQLIEFFPGYLTPKQVYGM
jgi:organic radical activating enzyme